MRHFITLVYSFHFLTGTAVAKRSNIVSRVEQRLMDELMANLSKYARPVSRSDLAVDVDFQVNLVKLGDLNIKEQTMRGSYRILMRWHNPHMVWNKRDYNGTAYINLPSNLIWTPDIMLLNSASKESKAKDDVYKTQVIMRNTGAAIWMSTVELEASCSMDVRWFPFDTQYCELEFASSSYTKKKLRISFLNTTRSGGKLGAIKHYSSGHWTMVNSRAVKGEEYFECCNDPFAVIKYRFKWKRLAMYWILYLVLPCLFLSFLALFSFFIPAETGERTGFGITAVLAMSVYLMVISDKLPEKSDESPVIGVLYTILFLLTSGALLSIIITTHLAFKTTEPPSLVRKYLGSKEKKKIGPIASVRNKGRGTESVSDMAMTDFENKNISVKKNIVVEVDDAESSRLRNRMTSESARTSATEESSGLNFQAEWKEISQNADRYLFRMFIVLTVTALAIVLISYYA